MLESAIQAVLASLPATEDESKLRILLEKARDEAAASEDFDPEPDAIRQQVGYAADLLAQIYGEQAEARAVHIAASPDATLFSGLVLAEIRSRAGRGVLND